MESGPEWPRLSKLQSVSSFARSHFVCVFWGKEGGGRGGGGVDEKGQQEEVRDLQAMGVGDGGRGGREVEGLMSVCHEDVLKFVAV